MTIQIVYSLFIFICHLNDATNFNNKNVQIYFRFLLNRNVFVHNFIDFNFEPSMILYVLCIHHHLKLKARQKKSFISFANEINLCLMSIYMDKLSWRIVIYILRKHLLYNDTLSDYTIAEHYFVCVCHFLRFYSLIETTNDQL